MEDESKPYDVTVHVTAEVKVGVYADSPEEAIWEATSEVETNGANLQAENVKEATAETDDVKEAAF